MVLVSYVYHRKSDNKTISGENEFYEPKKAVRFIYAILKSHDKTFTGYSCDDIEECNEMDRLLSKRR